MLDAACALTVMVRKNIPPLCSTSVQVQDPGVLHERLLPALPQCSVTRCTCQGAAETNICHVPADPLFMTVSLSPYNLPTLTRLPD